MSVGYKLYRDIRDFAPQDWTSGELVVAWVIADDASDVTRRSFIPATELQRRARMGERNVRKALEKLAGRGYEFRVSHGTGKDGREVYAAKGHRAEYVVPDVFQILVHGAAATACPVDNSREGGTTVPPMARLSTG